MFTLGYRWEWEWQGVLRSRGEVAVALPLEAGQVEEPRQCGGHSCRQYVAGQSFTVRGPAVGQALSWA